VTSKSLLALSVLIIVIGVAADVVLTMTGHQVPAVIVSVINAGISALLIALHAAKVTEAREAAVKAGELAGLLKRADPDADTIPPRAS
jgi:hypothetical protein